MAKGNLLGKCRINDDAEYRAFGARFGTMLLACGFIKTGDTGQVDWATAIKPAGANQTPHYEIWQMNDDLQATAPVFLKLWFGTNQSNANMPTVYVQVATATDGAGNLTGKISKQRRLLNSDYAEPNNQYDFNTIYTGGEGNRIGFWLNYNSQWVGAFQFQAAFILERTRNAAGEVTAEGVSFFSWHIPTQYGNESVYHTNQMLLFSEQLWSDWNDKCALGCYLRNGETSTFYQGKVAAFPLYPVKNGGLMFNPVLSILGGLDRDYANDVTVEIDFYGQPRTYLKMSYGAAFWGSYFNYVEGNQRDRTRALILWED